MLTGLIVAEATGIMVPFRFNSNPATLQDILPSGEASMAGGQAAEAFIARPPAPEHRVNSGSSSQDQKKIQTEFQFSVSRQIQVIIDLAFNYLIVLDLVPCLPLELKTTSTSPLAVE